LIDEALIDEALEELVNKLNALEDSAVWGVETLVDETYRILEGLKPYELKIKNIETNLDWVFAEVKITVSNNKFLFFYVQYKTLYGRLVGRGPCEYKYRVLSKESNYWVYTNPIDTLFKELDKLIDHPQETKKQ